MTTSFGLWSILPLLAISPPLIGYWIGVLGLGKCKRGVEWWCMLTGICIITLEGLFGLALQLTMFFGWPIPIFGSVSTGFFPRIAAQAFFILGPILFAVGFAIHGQRHSKHVQRIRELESILQAQNEELAKYRPS